MSKPWSDAAIAYLSNPVVCPRCDGRILSGACPRCGLDLRGETGEALWSTTTEVVDALRRRQEIVDAAGSFLEQREPQTQDVVAVAGMDGLSAPIDLAGAPTVGGDRGPGRASALAPQRGPEMVPAARGARAEWSVQSLLAIAGAGLVAIAAMVFAFFYPDLDDPAIRLAIIGSVTVVFGVGAMLTAKRLRLTAESLAALSAVFLGLDVHFVAELAPDGPPTWVAGGLGLLVAGGLLCTLGAWSGLRGWLLGGTAALVSFAPVLAGAADDWTVTRFGLVAVGVVAIGVHLLLDRIGEIRGLRLLPERVIATVAQVGAVVVVFGGVPTVFDDDPVPALLVALQLALAGIIGLVVARWIMPRAWSAIGGVLLVIAALLIGFVQANDDDADAWFLVVIAACVGAVLVVTALMAKVGVWQRLPFDGVDEPSLRTATTVSAFVVGAPLVLAAVSYAFFTGIVPNFGRELADASSFAIAIALVILATAATGARLLRRPSGTTVLGGTGAFIPWLVAPAIAVAALWAGFDPPIRAAVAIIVAAAIGAVIGDRRIADRAGASVRISAAVLAHGLLFAALLVVAVDRDWIEVIGLAVIAALVLVARLVPVPARAVHWGAGTAIALGVLAIWLERFALEPIDRLAIVAAVGAAIAIIATLVRRIPRGGWWAILVVTIVPFLLAVGSVVVERTGWTALSTGTMTALAVVIVLSRRPGLAPALRVAAAALIVPSIAVTAVCLGAQLLVTSGSPVVLPVIAVLVAGVLASASWIEHSLRRLGAEPAAIVTIAIELSAGLTGAIAVLLAVVRVASGFDTAMIVLIVIGVGAAVARVLGRRRRGWWVAAASWTGALWCALLLSNVDLLEPYVLPPAAAAVIVGVVLLAIGRSGRLPAALAVAGLGAGLLPTLLALMVIGSGVGFGADGGQSIPWRAIGLTAVSVAFLLIAFGLRRAPERMQSLRGPLFVAAMVAAVGPGVQAARWGVEADAVADGVAPMAAALPTALIAAALASLAARGLAGVIGEPRTIQASDAISGPAAGFDSRRWLALPALVLVSLGPVLAIRADWGSIWALWALMVALFALGVLTALRTVSHTTLLPPIWATAVAGWIVAVGSWSERELRVEVFSLSMGVAVLAMGLIHLLSQRRAEMTGGATSTAVAAPGRSLNAWPAGFAGSWWLLAPGILLILVPSVLSTGTDPVTWRAIMVIALALVAILVGSVAKLAAPFFIGLAVLPIENVVVFAVQIGRGVESLPWWITLATAGAVLLAIAMNAERRSAAGAKVSRIKEMR